MREILFRGKRIDNGEWVAGYLFEQEPPLQCFTPKEKEKSDWYIFKSGFADWNMHRPVDMHRVDPSTVGQFTGLLDSQYAKIFEGDKLQHENGIVYEVEWIEQLGGWYLSIPNTKRGRDILSCAASKSMDKPMKLDSLTIIGNIHENHSPINP